MNVNCSVKLGHRFHSGKSGEFVGWKGPNGDVAAIAIERTRYAETIICVDKNDVVFKEFI